MSDGFEFLMRSRFRNRVRKSRLRWMRMERKLGIPLGALAAEFVRGNWCLSMDGKDLCRLLINGRLVWDNGKIRAP